MAVWIIAVGMTSVWITLLGLGLSELYRRFGCTRTEEDAGIWVS